MTYDLNEAMKRLPEIQRAALASLTPAVKSDAVEYWPYQQGAFPYWWNRIESMTIETTLAGDIDIHRYTIAMALVIGHLTDEGYDGELPARTYSWIPAIIQYFVDHADLTSTLYPEPLAFLWIERGGAVITGIPTGTRGLTNSGVNAQQLSLVFSLDLPLVWEVY